ISSHLANYRESWEANRLIAKGKIHPTLSSTYPLEEVGQAALDVHHNSHQGKVGVLCLAPQEGLGVRDAEFRARHEDAINRFRGVRSLRSDRVCQTRADHGGWARPRHSMPKELVPP